MTDPVAALQLRYRGAPESLRRALTDAAAAPDLPRATRRELRDAARDVVDGPHGVGIVPFVAVSPDGRDGAVYRVIVTQAPRGDLFACSNDLAEPVLAWVWNSFGALTDTLLWPRLSGPPHGEGWEGRSVQLAMALALISYGTRRPLPAELVVTGALGPPGRVVEVRHLDAKRAVVARDLPHHRLYAPGDASLAEVLDAVLPHAQVVVGQAARHREEVATAWAALSVGRLQHVRAKTDRVLAESDDPAIRARAAWLAGAAALHEGHPDRGEAHLREAVDALPAWTTHPDDPPDAWVAEELVAWSVIALLDQGRPVAARLLADRALAGLEAATLRDRRWRYVTLQVAGSAHRTAVLLGELDAAEAYLHRGGLGPAMLVEERARSAIDLADVHRRSGRHDAARAALDRARGWLIDAEGPAATSGFLDLAAARIDAAAGEPVPPRPDAPGWTAVAFALLASRTGGADLAAVHARPEVRAKPVLQGIVAAEVCWQALHGGDARLDLLRDAASWESDDPTLRALFDRLATAPTRDDLAAWVARAPYG